MKKLLPLTLALLLCLSPLAAFEQNASQNKVLLRTNASWNDAKIPAQNIPRPEVTLVRIKIAPGKSLPVHKHAMINVAYIVAGTLRVSATDGKSIVLKAGDSICELINTWHHGENIGEDTVELLVFYVGEKDTPLSELKKE